MNLLEIQQSESKANQQAPIGAEPEGGSTEKPPLKGPAVYVVQLADLSVRLPGASM